MSNILCGHFRFTVRDAWIFCSDCECGIRAESKQGQRLLNRNKANELGLTPHQLAVYKGLVDSYRQLIEKAETDNPEVLARLANGGEK